MAKQQIRISNIEASRNFFNVLERVLESAEVVIEHDGQPVAMVSPIPQRGRLLSESIKLAEAHGSTVTFDGDFARDLEDIINSHREPLNPPI